MISNPEREKNIEVRIAANQAGNFNVNGRVVCYFGNNTTDAEDITLDLPIQVKEVLDNPDTQPTPALTSTATHTFNNSRTYALEVENQVLTASLKLF